MAGLPFYKVMRGAKAFVLAALGAGALLFLISCNQAIGPTASQPPAPSTPSGLVVEKIEPRTALPGQNFQAEIRITNYYPEAIQALTVSLDLSAGLEFLGAEPLPSEVGQGRAFWRFPSLGAGETLRINLSLRGGAGNFQNRVVVEAVRPVRAEASQILSISAIPGLTASLVDEPGVAPVGSEITYLLTIVGQGLGKAEEIDVSVRLPSGMDLVRVEAPLPHVLEEGSLRFGVFSLSPGERMELKFVLLAKEAGDKVVRATLGYRGFQYRVILEEPTTVYGD